MPVAQVCSNGLGPAFAELTEGADNAWRSWSQLILQQLKDAAGEQANYLMVQQLD